MKPPRKRTSIFWLLLLPLLSPAATIQWGGEFLSDDYLSDATKISSDETPDLDLTFSLGTFEAGFVPTENNVVDWSTNWKSITSTTYNLGIQYFTDSVVLEDTDSSTSGIQFNGHTFQPGEQVYLWGYNDQEANAQSQWTLGLGISSNDMATPDPSNENWEIPDLSDVSQRDTPLSWRVSEVNQVIFGIMNSTEGGGITTGTPAGTIDIQFASIPEPSQFSLFSIFTILFITKRRRKY